MIPHGAATPPATPTVDGRSTPTRPTPPALLTWGLLGPGKGIEWAIDALAELGDLDPAPDVRHRRRDPSQGARARAARPTARCSSSAPRESASAAHVTFDDRTATSTSLTELIRSADLVVLPYDSDDQVTSGVLVDAVAAGRPVVSTAFPHAVELLASGAGIVVPQRDPAALAAAIRSVLTDPELAAAMAAEARRLAPDLSWAAVARRYGALADRARWRRGRCR